MHEGKPLLLVGGGDDDNLYQWQEDELTEQLDLLVSVGGNFLRNTLSTRDEGNELPFLWVKNRYELSQWNETFGEKLDRFLSETASRNIIVQITLWDQHDFVANRWDTHFWNPANNNIGLEASRVYNDHAFFSAVKDRNALILPYQMKYIEKVLSITLQYDHVLYNITNEGWAGLEWEVFWAEFIRKEAKLVGKQTEITTMEHSPQLSIDAVLKYPDAFGYFEISQNNNSSMGYDGHSHWQHIMNWRNEIRDTVGPRPLMNEKVYGAKGQRVSYGSDIFAKQRFWRNVFAGTAGVRFHRPDAGFGLGTEAQTQIRALHMLTAKFDIPNSHPAPDIIQSSSQKESYCLQSKNGQIALYLVQGGQLVLNIQSQSMQIQELDIEAGVWTKPAKEKSKHGLLELEVQAGKPRVVVIYPVSEP